MEGGICENSSADFVPDTRGHSLSLEARLSAWDEIAGLGDSTLVLNDADFEWVQGVTAESSDATSDLSAFVVGCSFCEFDHSLL